MTLVLIAVGLLTVSCATCLWSEIQYRECIGRGGSPARCRAVVYRSVEAVHAPPTLADGAAP